MSNNDLVINSSSVVSMHPNVSSLKTANYTVTTSDYYIGVGVLTSAITITLPASPTTGDEYIVKDVDGYAGLFSITISGNGKNIDGNATFIFANPYASANFTFSGSQWSLSNVYAGSQNGNGLGVYANRPIQGQAGRTYYATDAGMMYYDDGNTWNPIGQTDVCTALKTSDFTWQNQSGATSTDYGSGIFMYAPSASNNQNVRFLYQTPPSTPYTVTAKFIHLGSFEASQSVVYGIGMGDGTKFLVWYANTNGNAWNLDIGKWDNPTTNVGGLFDEDFFDICDNMQWFRIEDDGTNRHFSISRDGVNFLVVYSTSNTTYLTTSRIGIILNPYNGDQYTSCVSWKVE